MNEKSLLDYGYDVLSASKDPLKFVDLFNAAVKASGVELADNEIRVKMSKFYTQLSLDGRFVTLTDNYWDLRSRHLFEQVHIDMTDAYSDDEDEEIDEEEVDKEEKEFFGETVDDEQEEEVDDLDFDKPVKDPEDEDGDF